MFMSLYKYFTLNKNNYTLFIKNSKESDAYFKKYIYYLISQNGLFIPLKVKRIIQ